MAGKKTTPTGAEPTEKEVRVANAATMKSYATSMDVAAEAIGEAREELSDATDIAKKKHLYVPAFKVAKGLHDAVKDAKNESIAAEKLAKWLYQFDQARKHFKLDELAKLQGRMFADGPIGEKDGEPPRERDEDGEEDPRPRHLRQPSASAASVEPGAAAKAVQDLAAKSGATLPDANLDKIGRGKPEDTKH